MKFQYTFGPAIVYLEDMPAGKETAAHGLSKAIVPMLQVMDIEVVEYFVNQTHEHLDYQNAPSFVRSKLVLARHQSKCVRNIWKLIVLAPALVVLCMARLFTPRPSSYHRFSDAKLIWAPIGIDLGSLVRVWCFSRSLGLPLHLYLVDDIETHPINARFVRYKRLIARILRSAERVYTITDELGVILGSRYGVSTRRLPLIQSFVGAGHPDTEVKQSRRFFGVYLGSINHLYQDGLRELIASVNAIRQATGQDLRLRFFSHDSDVRQLCDGEIPSWIVSGREPHDAVVRDDIGAAHFCFLPYSFQHTARTMVASSFPSKLLDYLLGARVIVVYAPEYSVASHILSASNAPYVVRTPELLNDLLLHLMMKGESFADLYQSVLVRDFGPGAVLDALNGTWPQR